MYTNQNLEVIEDGAPYTDEKGTRFPADYPKEEIPGLFAVTETQRPTDEILRVLGFRINAEHEQVWDIEQKSPEEIASELTVKLTAYREQRIRDGINVNGMVLRGDLDTITRLQGAKDDALEDPNYTVDWSVGGNKVVLNGQQIIALYAMGRAHIKKCFTAFFVVKDNLGNYTTALETNLAFEEAYANA